MTMIQALGGPLLELHGDDSHVRQRPGPETNWQDSVVLVWWDAAHAVGGFHRIGHEAHAQGHGMVAAWTNLMGPEGTYKHNTYLPLRDADRLPGGGWGSGDDVARCEYRDGVHVWTIADADVRAELRHTDFSPNVDCYPKHGSLGDEFAPAHFDVPGAVTGWLEMKGRHFEVNGLAIRDHGWGPRAWNAVFSHRWIAGCSGPDFGFVALSWHAADDSMTSLGWVVRGRQVVFAKSLDIIAYTEIDGAINRGGRLRMELADGETVSIECTPVTRAVVNHHHGICCVDTLCRFEGGGRSGFCDFETSSNLQHGQRSPVKLAGGALIADGFHPLTR